MSKLPKFECGGSLHLITNNQLGFTTDPTDDRSFARSSDIVKPFGIPVLRVNTAEPEAVIRTSRFMVRYWQKYGKDALCDMIGYRFFGHNELDEPSFTQPLMYKVIRERQTPPQQYADQLVAEGVITADEVQKIRN